LSYRFQKQNLACARDRSFDSKAAVMEAQAKREAVGLISYIYGILIMSTGILGHGRSNNRGSSFSLTVAVITGILVCSLESAWMAAQQKRWSRARVTISTCHVVLSLAVTYVMGLRFAATHGFIPSGLIALYSSAITLLYGNRWMHSCFPSLAV
jgi:hypothetical protein